MITAGTALTNQILKLRGRKLDCKVRIDYSDATINNTAIGTSSDKADGSYVEQLYNGREEVSDKYAGLDSVWILGDYALAPESEREQSLYEIGWWGAELSLSDRTFGKASQKLYGEEIYSENIYGETKVLPFVKLTFSEQTISKYTISFDSARGEYAEEFDLVYRDIDGNELDTVNVTGNSGWKVIGEITAITLCASLELVFKKWSFAGVNPKAAELFTSVSEEYMGDDLFNVSVSEARDLSGDGIPIGTTGSGQCSVKLFNRFRKFDYDNTTSALYNLIREGVKITPFIGYGGEWIQLGVFYAVAWDISTDSLEATVTGLDAMAKLGETEYRTSKIIQEPADEEFNADSAAEWNAGDLTGCEVSGDTLRMVL